MRFSLFTIAAIVLATVEAAVVEFNVVSPGSKTVQVHVNGQIVDLKAPNSNVPFYTGSVEVENAHIYRYVADNQPEIFARILPATRTFNDFYGRHTTYANLSALPRPLDNGKEWIRSTVNPDLFDTNYIPSIFVHGDQSKLNNLVENVTKDKLTVDLTIIGKDYVKTFSGVTLSISGAGKKNNPAKQSWRWTLAPGDTINNRFNFKIRHMEEDPTQIREKLYADVLRAMGTYSNQANLIRYYINGESFGTFNMLDDIKSYSYITAEFYNGQAPAEMGPLYDGSTGASFAVQADPYSYGSFKPSDGSPEGSEALHQLAVAFQELDVLDDNAVKNFEQVFDIDQFLRFMVMEYLGGSWDGYWEMQTNIGAYKDYANKNTWYFLGQDYDCVFGINMPVDSLQFSYKNLVQNHPEAIMINRLLTNSRIAATFESYIKDTVKHLFNNNILGKYIADYHEFIKDDIKWDRSITQKSPGFRYGWTYEDSYNNLFGWVGAPENNGGGAQYGLTQWIDEKSKVAAKDLNFEL